jgi:hypothetical protein
MLIHAVSAQEALVEAKLEIADLHGQLESLKAFDTLSADMEFVQDGYHVKESEKEAGNIVEYWGDAKKAVPLTRREPGSFLCALHKNLPRAGISRKRK